MDISFKINYSVKSFSEQYQYLQDKNELDINEHDWLQHKKMV